MRSAFASADDRLLAQLQAPPDLSDGLSRFCVPIAVRTSAGLLIARTRLRRWSRRAAIAVMALVTATLVIAPVVAAVALVAHVL